MLFSESSAAWLVRMRPATTATVFMLARLSTLNASLSRLTPWHKTRVGLSRGFISSISIGGKNVKIQVKVKPRNSEGEALRISKSISWLLRHGAKSEGLHMRPDGYVSVKELLGHPRLRGVDILTLEKLVKADSKKRFNLIFEPHAQDIPGSSSQTHVWWIRANQGHTLSDVELDLEPISSHIEIRMAVHGTSVDAWEAISKHGISRMGRNHIHLAQGLPGAPVTGGIRSSSTVLIFVNLKKALKAGIKFYMSSNGVILTPGNEQGYLEPQFFRNVQQLSGDKFIDLRWRWYPDGLQPLPPSLKRKAKVWRARPASVSKRPRKKDGVFAKQKKSVKI